MRSSDNSSNHLYHARVAAPGPLNPPARCDLDPMQRRIVTAHLNSTLIRPLISILLDGGVAGPCRSVQIARHGSQAKGASHPVPST